MIKICSATMNRMPFLSVIIPVFNEEKTILPIIIRLCAALEAGGIEAQYIIVDDGSTDATQKILEESIYVNDARFTFVFQEKNQGKGSAIRAALPHIRGTYTIIQDADLEYFPEDIPALVAYAKEHESKVVYGSRNIDAKMPRGGFWFYWGGRLLTTIANILFHQKLTDEACGYKLFSTPLLQSLPLTCKRFEFCPEVTALVAKQGIRIPEISVRYAPRGKEEGKKINYRDGIAAIATLLRIRFSFSKEWSQAVCLGLLVLGIFIFTWDGSVAGYEPDTIEAAASLTQGVYMVKRPAIGSSLLYLPLLFVNKVLWPVQPLRWVTLMPPFYSSLAAVLIFLIVNRLGMRRSVSMLVTLIVTVGSLMWPYSRLGMEYQEMLWIGVLLLALVCWRNNQKMSPLLIGAAMACLALSKSYGVVFIIPTLLFIGTTKWEQKNLREFFRLGLLLRVIGPTALVVVYNVLINLLLVGQISGAYSLAHEFQLVSWWDGVWGIFFSFGKSIFVYSPLLIPSLFFWPAWHKKFLATSVFILSGFVLYFALTAPFSYWSDETLSVRKLVPLIPFLHLPLFWGVDQALREKKKILLWLLGATVLIAGYVQMVNSMYTYFRYLRIVYKGNVDTLAQMRYNPQVSELYLNHRLFISFIQKQFTGESGKYAYVEETWMRHFQGPGIKNSVRSELQLELNEWNTPSVYFLKTENNAMRKSLLLVHLFLVALLGASVGITISSTFSAENAEWTRRIQGGV